VYPFFCLYPFHFSSEKKKKKKKTLSQIGRKPGSITSSK
jgi:hypothetical protein